MTVGAGEICLEHRYLQVLDNLNIFVLESFRNTYITFIEFSVAFIFGLNPVIQSLMFISNLA
jgi:hypothetical protein